MSAPQTAAQSLGPSEECRLPPTLRATGIALRAVAFLVDLAVWSVYWGVLLSSGRSLNGPVLAFLLVAPPFVYFPIAWGQFGTTLGMRLLRLRIVRATNGARIGYRTALIRFSVAVGLAILSIVLVGLALIALPMVTDQCRRGLHDRVADTLVVRPAQFAGWRVLLGLGVVVGISWIVLWFLLGGGTPA